jgi:predicted transcriptional regulator
MSIIILIMSMKSNLIDVLFKSKLRAQLLGLTALSPEKKFYVNQIARMLNASEGSIHRQLVGLHESGLLLRDRGWQ